MIALFDVDGVIYDYSENIQPGIRLLIKGLSDAGYTIAIWSAGGRNYAYGASARLGISALCVDKPPYPPTLDATIALLSQQPIIQFDDDPGEQVIDNFICIRCDAPMDRERWRSRA